MIEGEIFKLLLRANSTNTNDKLLDVNCRPENIKCFAKNVTDLIYESLQQKSSSSNIKRGSLLNFLNIISAIKEPHLHVNVKDALEIITNDYNSSMEDEPQNFSDLPSFETNVTTFYETKQKKFQKKLKRIEFINNCDQEMLDSKYSLILQRKFSSYEMKLFDIKILDNNDDIHNDMIWSREQQIQFAYNLLNIKSKGSNVTLRQILNNLLIYEKLNEFELDFLNDVWLKSDEDSDLTPILQNNFFFVLERLILKHAIFILKCNNKVEICNYLKENEHFQKLITHCQRQLNIYFKIKQLIYELYCFSFCNENILLLCNSN